MGRVLQLGLVSFGLLALAGAVGCQPNSTTSANTAGNGGEGGAGGNTGGGGTNAGGNDTGGGGTNAGGNDTGGSNTGGSNTGGTGGSTVDPCLDGAADATVYDVTKGAVGTDIKVKLEGVIAMSHKHLISHAASGSCLWGVFVSAPETEGGQQLTETAPYSGAIVLSYGTDAPADTPCPTGSDAISDNVLPGDVLTVVGKTSKFILNSCGQKPADSDIPQIQIFQTCKAEKTGNGAVPAPHVLTEAEITALNQQKTSDGPTVLETHNKWGGVKVRAENVAVDPWKGQNGGADTIVGPFGVVKLAPGGLPIADGLYYAKGSAEVCQVAPDFDKKYAPPFTFDHAQGFHYLAFCTWGLSNEDKCADYAPQSPDCAAAMIDTCYAE